MLRGSRPFAAWLWRTDQKAVITIQSKAFELTATDNAGIIKIEMYVTIVYHR